MIVIKLKAWWAYQRLAEQTTKKEKTGKDRETNDNPGIGWARCGLKSK